jgi:hypothetical protein
VLGVCLLPELQLACARSQGKVDGYVKVGPKKLFINHENRMCEIEPLCVLDIYVHQSRQRSGVGYKLFCSMLKVCHLHALVRLLR